MSVYHLQYDNIPLKKKKKKKKTYILLHGFITRIGVIYVKGNTNCACSHTGFRYEVVKSFYSGYSD